MELQAERVLEELNNRLPLTFALDRELSGSFRLGLNNPDLIFQFNLLPRSPADEKPLQTWRQQQEELAAQNKTLIHIWEDQWTRRREAVLSRIAAVAGVCQTIHGRETTVKRIEAPVAARFLAEHHLLVPLKGKYRFGLVHGNELVSLAVFSGGRKMAGRPASYRSFELLRFCHRGMYLVQGGLSKLLAAFHVAFRPSDVMTYVDLDWSEGHAFRQLGFIPSGTRPPQEFWINPREQLRHYPGRLPLPLERSSPEALHQADYYSIHNCGSLKLIKKYKE